MHPANQSEAERFAIELGELISSSFSETPKEVLIWAMARELERGAHVLARNVIKNSKCCGNPDLVWVYYETQAVCKNCGEVHDT